VQLSGGVLSPTANTRGRLRYKAVPQAHLGSCNGEIICISGRERREAWDRAWSSQLENKHWDSHPVIRARTGRQRVPRLRQD